MGAGDLIPQGLIQGNQYIPQLQQAASHITLSVNEMQRLRAACEQYPEIRPLLQKLAPFIRIQVEF